MTRKVSKAAKVLFPHDGITKGDLADYYAAVSEAMLLHVRGRPIMMQRFPDGIAGESIVQQRAPDYFPAWVKRATVKKRAGGSGIRPAAARASTHPTPEERTNIP